MAQSIPEREELELAAPSLNMQGEQRFEPTTNDSNGAQIPSNGSRKGAKKQKKRRPIYGRLWFWLAALVASAGTGWYVVENQRQQILSELPDPLEILSYARPGTLTIRAANGTILETVGPATREPLKLTDIPPQLTEAFIAAEDRRFYSHGGVDYQAIARAVRANLSAGEVVEGGSTITQQLARIVFLSQDPSLDRKVREALLSQEIEKSLTKAEILKYYLNLVYLGSGAYGVADAAWTYFSKPVAQLSLGEMATLAGLPPASDVERCPKSSTIATLPRPMPTRARRNHDVLTRAMTIAVEGGERVCT